MIQHQGDLSFLTPAQAELIMDTGYSITISLSLAQTYDADSNYFLQVLIYANRSTADPVDETRPNGSAVVTRSTTITWG